MVIINTWSISPFDLASMSLSSLLNSKFPLALTFVIVFTLNTLLWFSKDGQEVTKRLYCSIKCHGFGGHNVLKAPFILCTNSFSHSMKSKYSFPSSFTFNWGTGGRQGKTMTSSLFVGQPGVHNTPSNCLSLLAFFPPSPAFFFLPLPWLHHCSHSVPSESWNITPYSKQKRLTLAHSWQIEWHI